MRPRTAKNGEKEGEERTEQRPLPEKEKATGGNFWWENTPFIKDFLKSKTTRESKGMGISLFLLLKRIL
jgi:hypothetical protein